ncbi:MAG TPA: SCP2 sterol-binding domain-containing protein [Anaerolineae bacterium]|nr:SCP2 sterol-binding domain-containing protein [Anaerolineae bacterium]HQK14586.1 SCP2 sterol-binding domain-containing protein [Anaerolineae bacterium]
MTAIKFPSDEWIKQLSQHLNNSPSYEQSARNWEGDFIFIIEPDEAYPETAYLYLGLYHGKSPDAMQIGSVDEKEAGYVISAPFSSWRKVIEGKLDPIQGMMTRRLKLQGDMKMIMRYPKAAKEIIACTKLIPTDFGD